MNARTSNDIDIKEHEYVLLNEFAQDSMLTQATLSDKLGIAVGTVNWYIKRLIMRGWIKVSHLDRTRLRYDLTPEGMTVFTNRALLYARDSLKVYGDYRKKAKALVEELIQNNVREVYLNGDDETMDILRLTCIEAGISVNSIPGECIVETDGRGYKWRTK